MNPCFLLCEWGPYILRCNMPPHCDRLPRGPFLVVMNDFWKHCCQGNQLSAGALWLVPPSLCATHTCHSTTCLSRRCWNKWGGIPRQCGYIVLCGRQRSRKKMMYKCLYIYIYSNTVAIATNWWHAMTFCACEIQLSVAIWLCLKKTALPHHCFLVLHKINGCDLISAWTVIAPCFMLVTSVLNPLPFPGFLYNYPNIQTVSFACFSYFYKCPSSQVSYSLLTQTLLGVLKNFVKDVCFPITVV